MGAPALQDISIQAIYSGVMGLSLITNNKEDRDYWYSLLGEYAINWHFNENDKFVVVIRTRAGSYSLVSSRSIENHPAFKFLDDVEVITSSYRGNDGQLHHSEPVALIRLTPK